MTFINLMKEKELRHKVYFTLFVLAVCCALANIPVYGVNSTYLSLIFSNTNVLSFMNNLSGGSLSNLSVAGFGITSYITASIVMQLITIVFPKLETLRRDGERGRKLTEKVTFIFAMVLTLVYGLMMAIGFGKNGLLIEYSAKYVAIATITWMIGTFIVVYLGQKIEDYGIGNGITMILGFNILSRIPSDIVSYFTANVTSASDMKIGAAYVIGLIVALFIVYLIAVYLQTGVLNIPIKQTRKKASAVNTDGVIPVSVNIANVLPVIYASTLIAVPSIIKSVFGADLWKIDSIVAGFSSANWYAPTKWYHVVGLLIYVLLIVMFGFFASSLSFSSDEIADSMKKNGNTIPGVNPGADTIKFLEKRRKIMTIINVLFLLVIALVPDFICTKLNISEFSFLGTSLIIIISMLFDTALRLRAASIHNDNSFRLFDERR